MAAKPPSPALPSWSVGCSVAGTRSAAKEAAWQAGHMTPYGSAAMRTRHAAGSHGSPGNAAGGRRTGPSGASW
eukprot:4950227-Alexandrium_andersonii.AAC.1